MKKSFLCTLISSTVLLAGCGGENYQISAIKEFQFSEEKSEPVLSDICEKTRDIVKNFRNHITQSYSDEAVIQFDKDNAANLETFKQQCQRMKKERIASFNKYREDKKIEEKNKEIAKEETEKAKAISFLKTEQEKYKDLTWDKAIRKIINQLDVMDSSSYGKVDSSTEKGISELIYAARYNDKLWRTSLLYIYDQKQKEGIAELRKLSYADLQKKDYCATDHRKNSACGILEEIKREKRMEVIKGYSNDYASLKRDYNQCVEKMNTYLTSLNVNKQHSDIDYNIRKQIEQYENEIYKNYPCLETEEALKLLNLQYNHYEKLN